MLPCTVCRGYNLYVCDLACVQIRVRCVRSAVFVYLCAFGMANLTGGVRNSQPSLFYFNTTAWANGCPACRPHIIKSSAEAWSHCVLVHDWVDWVVWPRVDEGGIEGGWPGWVHACVMAIMAMAIYHYVLWEYY